ncbi:ABC transporter ATP-binding protein [Acinetobacter dispersus]|uniref:ABC transporter domain-containing protein n=1 Tax=Acinetobacter dispersus TaxID=70348 RepID=N9MWX2_9GAMM|nr:ABC transporter ATP-binding protein [Acinetobacter dispersus]ENW94379.1 hypothetical protein F904_01305 [Acinetobacter dispersus]
MNFFRLVKELLSLLDKNQRRKLIILQLLMILMAIMELVGVASIGPFMAIVSNKDVIDTNSILNKIYLFSGVSSKDAFLLMVGGFVLLSIASGSLLSIYTTWKSSIFASTLGVQLSDRLYNYYISNNWLFHLNNNSSDLINNISVETLRVTNLIIQPMVLMNSRIILAIIISTAVIVFDPIVAIIGAFIFVFSYFLIYKLFSTKLKRHGETISKENSMRFRLMSEGFGGIKDLIMLQRYQRFGNKFVESGKALSYAHGSSFALANIPRYVMEFVAFGSVVILIIYLISINNSTSTLLPILSIYALAGLKLLPAMQQIYSCFAIIRGSHSSFDAIKNDLYHSLSTTEQLNKKNCSEEIKFVEEIKLKNIKYRYPLKDKDALVNVNLTIKQGQFVGIVGASGSGKSTLIDLILGLIIPTSGHIQIDESKLSDNNINSWRKEIGYVPQNVFLTETTVAENIAFGLEIGQIDSNKIREVVKAAGLESWLVATEERIFNESVGERGVNLSGGQRQRVGIARALYNDNKILVLDEITSALDRVSEEVVMNTINRLRSNKTIIMVTHKMDTIKQCDIIFVVENGLVIDSGKYEDLVNRHPIFEKQSDNLSS